ARPPPMSGEETAKSTMVKPPQSETPSLAELRREIDRIDQAMHGLLMERGEIIDRLIAAKQTQETGSAFRPAREAEMMRRLVERPGIRVRAQDHRAPAVRRSCRSSGRDARIRRLACCGRSNGQRGGSMERAGCRLDEGGGAGSCAARRSACRARPRFRWRSASDLRAARRLH